jgi:hypothetical protein
LEKNEAKVVKIVQTNKRLPSSAPSNQINLVTRCWTLSEKQLGTPAPRQVGALFGYK